LTAPLKQPHTANYAEVVHSELICSVLSGNHSLLPIFAGSPASQQKNSGKPQQVIPRRLDKITSVQRQSSLSASMVSHSEQSAFTNQGHERNSSDLST